MSRLGDLETLVESSDQIISMKHGTPEDDVDIQWDVSLLIRAVRQLGEAAFEAVEIDLSGVDLDVIELLEGEE